jgi:hypothetical protein
MFGLLAFAAVVGLLIAMTGAPYSQTWHQRWGIND